MDIIMDGGPRIEFDGNDIKVIESEVDAVVQGDDIKAAVALTHTIEGVIIDIIDESGDFVVYPEQP